MFPLFCVENMNAFLNDFGEPGVVLGGLRRARGKRGFGRGGSLCTRLRESIKASTDNYKPAERRGWLIVQCSMPRAQPRGLCAMLSFPVPLCGPQNPKSHIPQPDNATVRPGEKAVHVPVINFLQSGHSLFSGLKEIQRRFTRRFPRALRLPFLFLLLFSRFALQLLLRARALESQGVVTWPLFPCNKKMPGSLE